MEQRQGSTLETIRRAQGFLDANNAILEEVNQSGARTNLDRMAAELSQQAVEQRAGRVNSIGETAKQARLRKELRLHHMRPIAIVAQAHLSDVPELTKFQLPPARLSSSTKLVAAARAMADAASQHAQVLVGGGLAPDFGPKLLAAAQAVEDSVSGREVSLRRTVGATGALTDAEKRGRKALKVIDALVLPVLESNAQLLAEWRSVKRFSQKPGPASGAEQGAKPAAPAAPGPQSAASVVGSAITQTAEVPEAPKAA